ncbi:hypothetical protein Tco_1464064 [Tanacetum coccineum]
MVILILYGIQILGITSMDVWALSKPKPAIFVIMRIEVAEQTNARFNITNAAKDFKMRNLGRPKYRQLGKWNVEVGENGHEEGRKRDAIVGIIKEPGVHSNFTSWSFVHGGIRAWPNTTNSRTTKPDKGHAPDIPKTHMSIFKTASLHLRGYTMPAEDYSSPHRRLHVDPCPTRDSLRPPTVTSEILGNPSIGLAYK